MPRIVIFVEGDTEGTPEFKNFIRRAVPELAKYGIGLHTKKRNGAPELIRKFPKDARNTIRVGDYPIALFDLYHNPFYNGKHSPDENIGIAKSGLIEKVDKKFRNGVSIHIAKFETEAWFFADEKNFVSVIKPKSNINFTKLPKPENINNNKNPAKRIKEYYAKYRKKHYSKVVDGGIFFRSLDPTLVNDKCPNFKLLVEDIKTIIKQISDS